MSPVSHMTRHPFREAWFRRKVAQLGAALKRLPPHRQHLAVAALKNNQQNQNAGGESPEGSTPVAAANAVTEKLSVEKPKAPGI